MLRGLLLGSLILIVDATFKFSEFVRATKQKKDNSLNAVNELDLADALEKLKSNDPNLTNLNINNHKDISELNAIQAIIECIPSNTHLKILCMANTQMHDRHAKVGMMPEWSQIKNIVFLMHNTSTFEMSISKFQLALPIVARINKVDWVI